MLSNSTAGASSNSTANVLPLSIFTFAIHVSDLVEVPKLQAIVTLFLSDDTDEVEVTDPPPSVGVVKPTYQFIAP